MKAAVIRFPGSNCDQDCHYVLNEFGFATHYVWHKEESAAGYDLIVLPGGFSYGDYLRCGAIARFSPVMKSVVEQAKRGVLVEVSPQAFPTQLQKRFFDLGRAGLRPVLAHPERYQPVWKDDSCLDPLLDDSLFMASRWQAAGNPAELRVWPDAVHGFNGFPLALTLLAEAAMFEYLARMLA